MVTIGEETITTFVVGTTTMVVMGTTIIDSGTTHKIRIGTEMITTIINKMVHPPQTTSGRREMVIAAHRDFQKRTVGHMDCANTTAKTANHQCKDIAMKQLWKIAWEEILAVSIIDGGG